MTGTYARHTQGNAVGIVNLAVIIDSTSTKQPALAKALTLATQFGAVVTLLSFDTKQSRASPHAPPYASLHAWLDHFAIPLRARGIDVITQVVNGDSADDSLLSWLRQSNVDCVLKDIHRHGLAKRALLTDTDWRLVTYCPVPLLLSKPRQWQDSPVVVAAVDPPHGGGTNAYLDHEIMAYAAHMAKRLSGTLHAFHALHPAAGTMTSLAGVPLPRGLDQALAIDGQRRRWAIKAFVKRYGVDQQHLHVTVGLPEICLPSIATERNADIVVMGALARNSVTSPEVGSTAESVIESLPCDVLVIKSPPA